MVVVVVEKDPASGSNFNDVVTRHLDIDWTVDFDSHSIRGTVTHTLTVKRDNPSFAKFDTKFLDITSVCCLDSNLSYTFEDGVIPAFGRVIIVGLPRDLKEGNEVKITFTYSTGSDPSALQFMKPEQTAGRRAPYLFSQCQPIHARALLPCMDTPAVKASYNAKMTVPEDLVALMSAVCEDQPISKANGQATWQFVQKVPIPSYLIALVVGALERRELSDRCAVWSEPEIVDSAASEFGETETMLQAAEALCGPYVWGRYDILVLPPTFPFGGMENPCVTFATPTLIAGDRSLANVITHEISHSWSGNLITNATWDHFWLNEGFTTFIERKITGKLMNKKFPQFSEQAYRHSLAMEGWALMKYICEEQFGPNTDSHQYTKLLWDTGNTNPDDAFSVIPYEKGHTFLFYLEELVGGPEKFDPYLKQYFNDFKYKCLTTADFKAHFLSFFNSVPDLAEKIDWDAWFNTPGMPIYEPKYDQSLFQQSEELANLWLTGDGEPTGQNTFHDLTTLQRILFFSRLINSGITLSVDKLQTLRERYEMDSVKNAEIRMRWCRLCLRNRADFVIPNALEFVTEQGRMKFTRPVYKALYDFDGSRPKALDLYAKNKPFMHPLTSSMVAKELNI